jgi:hypothetical protein
VLGNYPFWLSFDRIYAGPYILINLPFFGGPKFKITASLECKKNLQIFYFLHDLSNAGVHSPGIR